MKQRYKRLSEISKASYNKDLAHYEKVSNLVDFTPIFVFFFLNQKIITFFFHAGSLFASQ